MAVPGRLRLRIHSLEEAGLPQSRLKTLLSFWRFPFPPGSVLARPALERLFILNESASFLHSLVLLGLSFPVLVQRFCETYGISEQQAAADISGTLDFWDAHLLNISTEQTSAVFHPVPVLTNAAFSEHYRLNGRLVRVAVSDPELAAEISPRLESVQTAEQGDPDLTFQVWSRDDRVFLSYAGQILASEDNPNAVRAILLQEMVRRTEPDRDWRAILHAGACGLGKDAFLLAGKSQTGKTTLCAALMASGFTFYCDDSAALGQDGTVSPMPFRMMIREGSWRVLSGHFPELLSTATAERFGQPVRFLTPPADRIASSPAKVKVVLFVSYSPAEKTHLRPLLPFETLLNLQQSGFWVRHDQSSIAAFLAWLRVLPAYQLTYSNLEDAIATIRSLAIEPPGVTS